MGLLDGQGALTDGGHKKYQQLNTMFAAIEQALGAALQQETDRPLRLLDLCAGQGHVALLCAHAARHRWARPAHVLAVDADAKRVATARLRADALGLASTLAFREARVSALGSFEEEHAAAFGRGATPSDGGGQQRVAPHAVIALHGCDTASDEAIAFGVGARSHALLVAPCCQAELAARWAAAEQLGDEGGGALPDGHAFALIHRTPNLRREVAAHVTDALRVSLLKAAGYGVTC
eukprot:1736385-Prymnesium_polylepis.1